MSEDLFGCPNCHRRNRAESSFCVGCGSLLVSMACASCSVRSEPGDRYCFICGSFLRAQYTPHLTRNGNKP